MPCAACWLQVGVEIANKKKCNLIVSHHQQATCQTSYAIVSDYESMEICSLPRGLEHAAIYRHRDSRHSLNGPQVQLQHLSPRSRHSNAPSRSSSSDYASLLQLKPIQLWNLQIHLTRAPNDDAERSTNREYDESLKDRLVLVQIANTVTSEN